MGSTHFGGGLETYYARRVAHWQRAARRRGAGTGRLLRAHLLLDPCQCAAPPPPIPFHPSTSDRRARAPPCPASSSSSSFSRLFLELLLVPPPFPSHPPTGTEIICVLASTHGYSPPYVGVALATGHAAVYALLYKCGMNCAPLRRRAQGWSRRHGPALRRAGLLSTLSSSVLSFAAIRRNCNWPPSPETSLLESERPDCPLPT